MLGLTAYEVGQRYRGLMRALTVQSEGPSGTGGTGRTAPAARLARTSNAVRLLSSSSGGRSNSFHHPCLGYSLDRNRAFHDWTDKSVRSQLKKRKYP